MTEFKLNIELGLSPEMKTFLSTFMVGSKNSVGAEKQVEEKPKQKQKAETAQEPAPSEAEQTRELSVVDVRNAMHETRRRIEGDDYENTDSEGHVKWHKQLTSAFKNIASLLGSEKPTALTSTDSIQSFIDETKKLVISGDKIASEEAPF